VEKPRSVLIDERAEAGHSEGQCRGQLDEKSSEPGQKLAPYWPLTVESGSVTEPTIRHDYLFFCDPSGIRNRRRTEPLRWFAQ